MVSSEEKLSKGLLTAQQMMEKLALAEAQKAAEAERRRAAAEAEKKALIDKLSKPPDITEEERIKRAAKLAPQREDRNEENCQAGWAVMIVASLRPELFGPGALDGSLAVERSEKGLAQFSIITR